MPEDNINAQPPEEFENQDKNLIKKVLVAIWNLTILSVLVGVSIYTISESIRQYDMLESYINMDTQLAPLMFAIMAPELTEEELIDTASVGTEIEFSQETLDNTVAYLLQ